MKSDKSEIHRWLQTGALIAGVIATVALIVGDLNARRVEATLKFVVDTAREYRKIDFEHSERKDGELQPLTLDKAIEILCDSKNKEKDEDIRNMLAQFEWMAIGVRKGGLDFDTVMAMRGTYYTTFFKRWHPYMQARVDFVSEERQDKLYMQFEWLVKEVSTKLNLKFEGLERNRPKFKCPNTNKSNT